MKIKCVSNVDMFGGKSEYLTPGKVYDMVPCDQDNDAGDIINDYSDTIFEYLVEPAHGKWEKVE